ncbi:MAG: ATP-binding protein [Acidimicrobiales bacterium]
MELPADASVLPATRQAVDGYLLNVCTREDDRADVVLAVNEACANVIRHAFPRCTDGRIRLVTVITDADVEVSVEDDGVGFEPTSVPEAAGAWDTSGRGLFIINEVMNLVELVSPTETGGTRVVMQKALTHSNGPAPHRRWATADHVRLTGCTEVRSSTHEQVSRAGHSEAGGRSADS